MYSESTTADRRARADSGTMAFACFHEGMNPVDILNDYVDN